MTRFTYVLKDFKGQVVKEIDTENPLTFPYLLFQNRLFVTARDIPGTFLERSHHVWVNDASQLPPEMRRAHEKLHLSS